MSAPRTSQTAPDEPSRPSWDDLKAQRDGTTNPLAGPGRTAGERAYIRLLTVTLGHAERTIEEERERAKRLRAELRELGVKA